MGARGFINKLSGGSNSQSPDTGPLSEIHYGQLFERNLAVQLLIDPASGQIVDANPAAVDYYGYNREKLRSMLISQINTLTEEEIRLEMERARAQKTNRFFFKHRLASGEVRDVEVFSSPIDMDGRALLYSIIHDITETRRAEQALSDNERRFRAIFDQTFQFIGLLAPDGTVLEANLTGLEFGGLKRADVIGKPLWDASWWRGEMPTRIREAIQIAATGRLFRGEMEMSGASGQTVAIDFSLKPVPDEHGNIILLIPEGRDVSDFKRVVRALRETNQTLEALVESSPLPIIALDRTGNIKMWNPAAERIFGWASNDVLGRPNPLITVETGDVFDEMFFKVLKGESFHNIEVTYPRKDGSLTYVSLSAAPLRDARAEIDGVMILAMDITDQKQAAEALRQSEAELRALFGAMTDVILVLNSDARYLKVAPTGEQLLVQPRDGIVGKTLYDFFPPDDAARYHDFIRLALESREPVKVEYSIKLDNKEIWFVATISPMLEDTVVWVARDITERKRSEALQSALYRIADMTAAAEDMHAFYAAIHRVVGELMYAPNFYIALYDRVNDWLSFPYSVDERDPEMPPQRPGEGLTGHVLRSGRPLWVHEDEMRERALREGELVGSVAVDWLGVPLKSGEDAFGVLAVQSYSPDVRFTEQDLELLTYVSKHISAALERKQAAEALRASEERYRTLIETSPDTVTFTDLDRRIVFANQQAAAMFGVSSPDQLHGRQAIDLLAPEDRQYAMDDVQQVMRDGSAHFQRTMIRADGTHFPVELSVALIYDANSRPMGLLAIVRDITERKRTELAEREQRALAEALRNTAAAINSTLQLDDLFDRILSAVGTVVPHDSASIMLIENGMARAVRWIGTPFDNVDVSAITRPVKVSTTPNLQRMTQLRQPYIIHNVVDYPGWNTELPANWVRSYLGTPIIVNDDVVGFLNLDSRQLGFFTQDHARRLQAFGDQVAIALRNAWLYESEKRQVHLSRTLQEVGALLTSQLSLNEVLESIFDLLGNVIQHDAVSLVLLNEQGRLEQLASRGYHDSGIARDFSNTLELDELHRRWGQSAVAVISDTENSKEWIPASGLGATRSWIGAALRVKGELIGVLNIDSYTPNAYSQREAETAVAFANQAAIALHNAALYESERRQREVAELIRDTTSAVASSLDAGEVLPTLAIRLRQISGFHACSIFEWDRDQKQVRTLSRHCRAYWETGESVIYYLKEYPMTRQVLVSGQPAAFRVRDADVDAAEHTYMLENGLAWMILLPVHSKDGIVGLAEIGAVNEPAMSDAEAIRRCEELLRGATDAMRDPLWEAGEQVLMSLAEALAQTSGAAWAELSTWDKEENAVRSAAAYSDLTWEQAEGPSIPLSQGSSLRRALEGDQTVVTRLSDAELTAPDRARLISEGLHMKVTQPLSIKGNVIGLVELDHNQQDRAISDEELRLWRVVVDQAAVALENAGLFESSQRRNQQLAVLNEITRIGSVTLDLHELLQTLAKTTSAIISGDGCMITLWNPRTRSVTPAAVHSAQPSPIILDKPLPPEDRTLTRAVIEAGHSIAIENIQDTPHVDRKFIDGTTVRAVLGLPLQADGRALGALILSFQETHRFTADEIRWAEQAAELISLAIAKAQAYEEMEDRVEERTAQLRNVNQRLMAMTQLKDEFVANVSHELRTPITSIKLHHLLLQKAKPETFDQYMQRLIRETDRLEYIINDLLRLSEMDRDDVALNYSPVDVNSLAHTFITDRALLAEQRGLTLAFEPTEPLPEIKIDQKLIGQSLSVLVTNALNYTPRGGSVTVSTRHVVEEKQEWVVLSVKDTGHGITIDEQGKLFNRFYRGKVGKDSDAAGTGLGLAIAREIVERHQGRLDLFSEGVQGKGSTFSIWLPMRIED